MHRRTKLGSAGQCVLQSQICRLQSTRSAPHHSRAKIQNMLNAQPRAKDAIDTYPSADSFEWTLLHRVTLQSVAPGEGTVSLEVSDRVHHAKAAAVKRVFIDAKDLQDFLESEEFTIFNVSSIAELCEQRLTCLTSSKTQLLRVRASPADREGQVTVSIYGDLRHLFAEMVTSWSSEFSWRLSHDINMECFGNSSGTHNRANTKLLGINCVDVDGMGEASTPSEFKLPLLPHQQRSLAWMMMRESIQEPCVHERHSQKRYKCSGLELDLELQVNELFSLRGGVLCDVVGSGKTATVLALVCCQNRGIRQPEDPPLGTTRATLVMCPPNVHAQWLTEVQKFCPTLNVVSLEVADDLQLASHDFLMGADLVVAPYELLTMPGVAGSGDALKDLCWRRVVLDEFHELCSKASRTRQLCSLLIALKFLKVERQWGLSGTPEAFLNSALEVVKAADYFRCDISNRTAPVFVEYFCRQARVAIPVEVHEHMISVRHTPAERALYFDASQQVGDLNLSKLTNGTRESAWAQKLLLLSSHFLPNDYPDAPSSDCNSSADEVCAAMLQRKENDLSSAIARVTDLPRSTFLNFCILVESMDQQLSSTLADMYRQGEFSKGFSENQAAKDQQAYIDLTSRIVQPRKTMHAHMNTIKQWCRHVEGQSVTPLFEVISPETLRDLCGALQILKEHVVLPTDQAKELHVFLRRLDHDCESIVNSQRNLDFFMRTWDAFQSGTTNCPVCLEDVDAYIGNFLYCGHVICVACANRLQDNRCPICRDQVPDMKGSSIRLHSFDRKVVPPRNRQLMLGYMKEHRTNLSSKLRKMLESLRDIRSRDVGSKVLIFLQWNSLRHHVSQALQNEGVKYLSLEGSIFDRSRILKQFKSDSSFPILLLSLEDSASGTNLTVASHVFLLHPMLASSAAEAASFESQAIGRVRRLGQTRPVHVWRFVTLGTLEESLWKEHHLPPSA